MTLLYIGIFASSITDADLRAFLLSCGVEAESKVLVDHYEGYSRRVGAIYTDTPREVIEACNGKTLGDYPVKVAEAHCWRS